MSNLSSLGLAWLSHIRRLGLTWLSDSRRLGLEWLLDPSRLKSLKKNKESLDNSPPTRTPPTKQLGRHANKITCKYVVITKEILVMCVNELHPKLK